MDMHFIFGLALAIPLSIIANILTPKVTEWWANTDKERRRARDKQVLQEYERIKGYKNNWHKFHGYLIAELAKIVILAFIVSAGLTLIGTLTIMLHHLVGETDLSSNAYRISLYTIVITLMLLLIVGYLSVSNIFRRMLNTRWRVQNFDEYEEVIQSMKTKDSQTDRRNEEQQPTAE